jgi:uncharacterized protein (TIGR03382 family)
MKKFTVAAYAFVLASGASMAFGQIELTTNGNFETGDTSGWSSFPSGQSSFAVSSDAFAGNFSGRLENLASGSAALIKQANLGIGIVTPSQQVTISFWAKGSGAAGGVQFAEFFSEIDGGGVSSSVLLGNQPLFVTDQWQRYNFTTPTGVNVSGGVTLQLAAVTGANIGSTSLLFVDNVSVSVIPTPASAALLGLGGLAALRRRR